jgi:hypothetical protein
VRYEIKSVLRDLELEPPILFEKLIEKAEKLLAKVCREARYELGAFPDVRLLKFLDEKIAFYRRIHSDTVYCNGNKYYVIAYIWELDTLYARIVTKFKLIDVER